MVNTNELYKELLWRKGEKEQIAQAIEELNELAVALRHYDKRAVKNDEAKDAVISEIADAKIMIEQMEQIFGVEEVAEERERKLQRQLLRITTA